ncbi:MAG: TetR/AcrR family transcriptional regulator [Deferribacterales bacterium]
MGVASMTAHKKSRTELRSEATRQSLMTAAKEVFAESGLDISTIDDITARANVGKGTFYLHFANKSELINVLITASMSELCAALDKACKNQNDLDSLLDSLIRAHLKFFSERRSDFILFFQGRSDLTIKHSYEGIDEPILSYLEHVAELIDNVVKYHLPQSSLTRIACAVAGFLSGYFSFAVISNDEANLEEMLNPVRKALVASLSRFIKEAVPADAGSI